MLLGMEGFGALGCTAAARCFNWAAMATGSLINKGGGCYKQYCAVKPAVVAQCFCKAALTRAPAHPHAL
jgi:hypothetical protein